MTTRRLLAALALLHLLAVAMLFRGLWFGDAPAVDSDLGMHFYRAALLRETGAFPGPIWDPGYLAGYLAGGALDVDNRLGETGVFLLRFLPPGAAWNWTLMLLFATVPAFLWRAARGAGLEARTALLATATGVLLFWSMRRLGNQHLSTGLYGWAMAAVALPAMFVAWHRLRESPRWPRAAVFGLVTAFCGLAHALSALYLLPLTAIVAWRWRLLTRAHVLALGGAAALAAAIVVPFALPVLRTLGEVEPHGLDYFFQTSPSIVLATLTDPERVLPHAVLLLAGLGLFRRRLGPAATDLALVGLAVTFVALFAFLIPGSAQLQPLRNLEPAAFLAIVPAAETARGLLSEARRLRWALAALGLLVAAPALGCWGITAAGMRPYHGGPQGEAVVLIDWLRTHTDPRARVLFEDGRVDENYGLGGYVARALGRPVIGGPHPVTFAPQGATTLMNGWLFRRPIAEIDDATLAAVLREYAIGTVVVWSPASLARFQGRPELARIGPYHVLAGDPTPTLAEGAPGLEVEAAPGGLHVRGATTSPTRLRWHFDPHLITDPPLPMRPSASPLSPVGFLEVENGAVTAFEIRLR